MASGLELGRFNPSRIVAASGIDARLTVARQAEEGTYSVPAISLSICAVPRRREEFGLLGGADRHALLDQAGLTVAVALGTLVAAGLTGRLLLRVRIATRALAIGIGHEPSVRDGRPGAGSGLRWSVRR